MDTVERSTIGSTIAEHGRHRTNQGGELLFVEGDQSDRVYACVSGRVQIILTMPSGQRTPRRVEDAR